MPTPLVALTVTLYAWSWVRPEIVQLVADQLAVHEPMVRPWPSLAIAVELVIGAPLLAGAVQLTWSFPVLEVTVGCAGASGSPTGVVEAALDAGLTTKY